MSFALLFASTVCNFGQAQTSSTSPVVTLKRTRCFGMCRVYEVSIFTDGTVQWNGNRFVSTIGMATARLPKAQVEELIRMMSASRFQSLNSSYRNRILPDGTMCMSDLPTTYLTFAHDGVTKTVEDYCFAPDELNELERLVDRISNSHRWWHDRNAKLTLESVEPSYQYTMAEDLKNELIVTSDVHSQTKPGFTKMMQAAGKGDIQSLQNEIESGADINAKDETGWTALMMAAVEGQTDAVSVLLKHGAQIRATDKNGDTVLIGAAANPYLYGKPERQVEVVQRLLAAGADVKQMNDEGETALMWAAKAGNPEVVQILLDAGADPNQRDRPGHNPAYHVQQWLSMRPDDTHRSRYQQTLSILQLPSKP